MELRQLEYFLMVSKVNSFTRAAERLYVSQPAVTNAIRSLEEELGILLFDRSQKQALLTTEGQVFYNHVENVMHGVSKTISEINELKNLNTGILKLGITPLAGVAPIPQLLATFRASYPHIKISFLEENVSVVQKALIEDKIDLGIIIQGEDNNFIENLHLGTQELVVCCSKEHRFHQLPTIDLSDLVDEPLILFKHGCLLRKLIITEFEHRNTLPQITFESNHIQTIKNLVACNIGLSIIPRDLCEHDSHLAAIPLKNPIHINIAIARKKNKYLSHAAQALLNLTSSLTE
ncbi:LysR family transcriptional regulator [Anaerosinus massiliensis]|uniref:LysR family transcriptional regulator n=1 Tax=Massilibacillus massiliensis TaxID=1806837 RepID=UPI000A5A6FED|nr:LysR family transcriptional regulator [Massilibacillus massiliensis]